MKILSILTCAAAFVGAAAGLEASYSNGQLGKLVHKPTPMVLAPAPEDGGPKLVGYGCDGASGPLWARKEDDFPKAGCKEIVGEF